MHLALTTSVVALAILSSTGLAVGSPTGCGTFTSAAFADMHDGDVKNVTLTKEGALTMTQIQPVPWTLTVHLDMSDCTATVDFSKSKKPAHPPVPLRIRLRTTTVGTYLVEFTDPSGTINSDPEYPINVWTTEHEMMPMESCTNQLAPTSFQDMHDGDVKIVSISRGVLTLGQPGIWNLTTTLDPKTCRATVDFSKTSKPAQPPVPLTVSVSVASSKGGGRSVIMTWTDPSKTISPASWYPLNLWMDVRNRGGGGTKVHVVPSDLQLSIV